MTRAAPDDRASAGEVVRSLAFYVAFYLGTAFFVLATLAATPFGPRAVRIAVRGWSRWHRGCMRWLLGIRFRFRGPPPPPGSLIALKHESFAEAIDLPAMFDWPVVFAKAELTRIPLWGKAGVAYGLVPVERDQGAKALRAMITAARKWDGSGRCYVIFPEGTRVPHGTRPPLRAGFAGLYKLMGAPVVPAALDSGPLYQRHWKRSGTITVQFAEPIPPGLPREEIEQRVHAAINALNPPEISPQP